MQSITKDVRPPDSVRVGSPLKYARTQQFGSGGPRPFYLSIIPDTEPGARGTKYQRDAYGRLLGRITLRQDAAAKRQLVTIDVRPRAFLVPPTDAEWEEIGELIGEFLFGRAA